MENDETHRRRMRDQLEKVRAMVDDIEVAMLTTTSPTGDIRSRPMGTVVDSDGSGIWLFLSRGSQAARELRERPCVGLSFADPERDRYVSLSGEANLVEDEAEARRVWRPQFAKWFPGGPGDLTLALVYVRVTQAEYWDDSAKLMADFFETLAAPYTGIPPQALGEHARVRRAEAQGRTAGDATTDER